MTSFLSPSWLLSTVRMPHFWLFTHLSCLVLHHHDCLQLNVIMLSNIINFHDCNFLSLVRSRTWALSTLPRSHPPRCYHKCRPLSNGGFSHGRGQVISGVISASRVGVIRMIVSMGSLSIEYVLLLFMGLIMKMKWSCDIRWPYLESASPKTSHYLQNKLIVHITTIS